MARLARGAAGCLACVASSGLVARAQCAMCKAAAEGGGKTAGLAESLNLGILVLMVPAILIFCAIFALAFKYGRGQYGQGRVEGDQVTTRPKRSAGLGNPVKSAYGGE